PRGSGRDPGPGRAGAAPCRYTCRPPLTSEPRHRRDQVRDRRALSSANTPPATISQAANAIQKNTSETTVNVRQPVSPAIAYVAAEYIPSGKTAAHQAPARWVSSHRPATT